MQMNITKLAWQIARTRALLTCKKPRECFSYGMKKAHAIAKAKRKCARATYTYMSKWNRAKVMVDRALMPSPVWTDSFGIEKV